MSDRGVNSCGLGSGWLPGSSVFDEELDGIGREREEALSKDAMDRTKQPTFFESVQWSEKTNFRSGFRISLRHLFSPPCPEGMGNMLQTCAIQTNGFEVIDLRTLVRWREISQRINRLVGAVLQARASFAGLGSLSVVEARRGLVDLEFIELVNSIVWTQEQQLRMLMGGADPKQPVIKLIRQLGGFEQLVNGVDCVAPGGRWPNPSVYAKIRLNWQQKRLVIDFGHSGRGSTVPLQSDQLNKYKPFAPEKPGQRWKDSELARRVQVALAASGVAIFALWGRGKILSIVDRFHMRERYGSISVLCPKLDELVEKGWLGWAQCDEWMLWTRRMHVRTLHTDFVRTNSWFVVVNPWTNRVWLSIPCRNPISPAEYLQRLNPEYYDFLKELTHRLQKRDLGRLSCVEDMAKAIQRGDDSVSLFMGVLRSYIPDSIILPSMPGIQSWRIRKFLSAMADACSLVGLSVLPVVMGPITCWIWPSSKNAKERFLQ